MFGQGIPLGFAGGGAVLEGVNFLMVGGGGAGGNCANMPSNYGPSYESGAGGGGSGEVRWSLGSGTPTHTAQNFVMGTVYNIVIGGQGGTTSLVGSGIDIRAGGGGTGGYGGGTSTGAAPAVPDPANGGYQGGSGPARSFSASGTFGHAINASGTNPGGVTSTIAGSSLKYGASWPGARLVTQNAYNNGSHVAIQDSNGYPSYSLYDGWYDISYNLSGTYTATGTYGTSGYSSAGRGGLGGAAYYHSQLGNRRMLKGSGAPGILILRFPTASVSSYTTTGATSSTDGADTILSWSSSGSRTIQFD